MKIVRKIKAWWSGVKFRHHMRERDKARATALYFLRAGHKDLCNVMLREAINCEERARHDGALHWWESQKRKEAFRLAESREEARDCFAKINSGKFTLDDWLDAMEKRNVMASGHE